VDTLSQLVDEFLQTEFRHSPTLASRVGLTAYDHLLDDLSADAFELRDSDAAAFLHRFEALPDEALGKEERIDRDLASAMLRGRLVMAEWQGWKRDPLVETIESDIPFNAAAHPGPSPRSGESPGPAAGKEARPAPTATRPGQVKAADLPSKEEVAGRVQAKKLGSPKSIAARFLNGQMTREQMNSLSPADREAVLKEIKKQRDSKARKAGGLGEGPTLGGK